MGTCRHWEDDGREIPSPKSLSPSPSLVLTLTHYCTYLLQPCLVVSLCLYASFTSSGKLAIYMHTVLSLCSHDHFSLCTQTCLYLAMSMPTPPSMFTGRQHCIETPAPWDHTGDQQATGLGFNGLFSFMAQSWDSTSISNIVFHTSAALPTFSLLPRSPSLLSQKLFVLIKWKSKVFLNRPKP